MVPKDPHIAQFEAIFYNTKDKLYGFVKGMVRDESLTQDCMQQCYLKLWESFNSIDTEKTVLPLLYTYARNLVIDHLRKSAREELVGDYAPWEGQLVDVNSTEHYMAGRENARKLNEAIQRMPPRRRIVFQLVKLQGLSYREAGEQLGISTHTVERHIHEAYKFLASEWSYTLFIYCLLMEG